MGRITELIESDKLTDDLGLPPLNAAEDRVMLCGSPGMLRDLKHMLEARGFKEGNTSTPGDFVVERAFARMPNAEEHFAEVRQDCRLESFALRETCVLCV